MLAPFTLSPSLITYFPVLDVKLSFIPQMVSCSHSRVLVFIYYCLDTSVGHLRLMGMLFFLVQGSIFRLYIPLYALLHDRDDTLNDVTTYLPCYCEKYTSDLIFILVTGCILCHIGGEYQCQERSTRE